MSFYIKNLTGAPIEIGDLGLTLDAGLGGNQTVNVGGLIVGGSVTGLTNDATVYAATIAVDGGAPQTINVTGSLAQTYTTLISEINTDLTGATAALTGGNIIITSDTVGHLSSIAIVDTDLFSSLTAYVAINAAVEGTGTRDMLPEEAGDVQSSGQAGGDLKAQIDAGNIVVVDPKDGATDLSQANSLLVVQVHNDPNWGIRGAVINDLDDVDTAGSTAGDVLQLSGGTFQVVSPATLAGDMDLDDLNNVSDTSGHLNTEFFVLVGDSAGGFTVEDGSTDTLLSNYTEDKAGNLIAGSTQTDLTITYNPSTNAMVASVDDSYLRNDGDTLDSGTLTVASGASIAVATGGVITWVDTPTGANDLTNKAYVDALVSSSTTWRDPIECPNLTDIVSAEPGSPPEAASYVKSGGTQNETWGAVTNVVDGDILEWNGTAWVRLGVCVVGTRFIATGEIAPNLGSGLYAADIRSKDLVEVVSLSDLTLAASWSKPSNSNLQGIYFGDANQKALGDATGLANDATVYDFDVDINGTPNAVSIVGSAAQTFATLITEIDADLTGATADIVEGHLHITGDNLTDVILISHGTTLDLLAVLTDFEEIRGAVTSGITVLANNPGCLEFGHTYLYSHDNHNWTEIAGPGTVGAGDGLSYTGSTLNVNFGAGIAQLPVDEVGIDLYDAATGAIILTTDGAARTATTGTKLHLLLDSTTLVQGASGLKVDTQGITEGELNTSVAGLGIAGGNGTALSFDPSELTATATTSSDFLVLSDADAAGAPIKRAVTDFLADQDIVTATADGILVRTAADTYTSRTLTASAVAGDEGISIVDGDGVAGNPTIGVDIVGQAASAGNMIATDLFLMYDGGNNVKLTGQELADGVSSILGGLGNAYTTIQGDTGSATAGSASDTLKFAGATNGGINTIAADGTPDLVTFALDVEDLTLGTGPLVIGDEFAVSDNGTTLKFSFQDLVEDLDIPYNITGDGFVVRTADNTFDSRAITVSAVGAEDGLAITDGDGIAGNPVIGLDIDNNAVAGENMVADDKLIGFNTSETANETFTGQEIADGVQTILGFDGLQITTVNASTGTQEVLTLVDATRTNKNLSVGDTSVNWAENRVKNNDWLNIGRAADALSGYVVPLDATIVKITAHTSDAKGNTKPILLYVNGVLNTTVGTFSGAGEQQFEDVTADIDVAAGDKLRLRGGTGGTIEDTVITLWLKWRG